MLRKILVSSLLLLSTSSFADCVITGCNSEICSDGIQPRVGICEWKPEYECYHQYGVCAADQNGQCGWVQSPELLACLEKLQQELSGSQGVAE